MNKLKIVIIAYLILAGIMGSRILGEDEFSFIREPYELLGGDYTKGYIKNRDFSAAIKCVAKSYYFFWNYRPLNSPIIPDKDKNLFIHEEKLFDYQKPETRDDKTSKQINTYESRLIVPEPDRFYSHGAGKPLLPLILSIPQLAMTNIILESPKSLLKYQFSRKNSPIFLVLRFAQYLSGLFSIYLTYLIIRMHTDEKKTILGVSIFSLFPTCILYFPDIHADSIMVPFLLLTVYYFFKKRYLLTGIFLGLSLASKNVAVFLFPSLLLLIFLQNKSYLFIKDKQLILKNIVKPIFTISITAIVILFPFANPVSYTYELLTPIMNRPIDARGENINRFKIVNHENSEEDYHSTTLEEHSKLITITKKFFFLNSSFFFMILSLFFIIQNLKSDLTLFSSIFIFSIPLFTIPFGNNLGYRYLMYIPFFSIILTEIVHYKYLKYLLLFLIFFDFILLISLIAKV